jgi:hypothetical protein
MAFAPDVMEAQLLLLGLVPFLRGKELTMLPNYVDSKQIFVTNDCNKHDKISSWRTTMLQSGHDCTAKMQVQR